MAPRSVRSACDRGSSAMLVSHGMGDQLKLLLLLTSFGSVSFAPREAPPCFGRHVKPLVPAVFSVFSI
jgi:hypothetical protein